MATYLCEVNYTAAAMAALVANPQDRSATIAKVIKNLGGKQVGFWFAFGKSDVVTIVEMPDNISAAALSMAISAGGACSRLETTPLMSTKDGVAAMKMASRAGYKRPKGS